MPDQACANGLALYDIPQDLHDLFPLERRVISLRIPFITVIFMHRYGGHYKMNGAPVNVPATLDHVLDILPRMPNQLQLHPFKLKRWIQYKSHYMYDMVRRDKIIGALVWLKHHNTHYTCISVNTDWRHGPSHILDITTYQFNEIFAKMQQEKPASKQVWCLHILLSQNYTIQSHAK